MVAEQAAVLGRLFDEPITELPEDLYIPPEALRVFLEAFEGPLDLLLYLIRRQNLDILAIDVAAITRQYIEYVELMKAMEIELGSEEHTSELQSRPHLVCRLLLDTAPPECYTLSLHDALPICRRISTSRPRRCGSSWRPSRGLWTCCST